MKRMLACLWCGIPLLGAAGEPAPAPPIDITMQWSVDVDATGAITSLQPVDDGYPELHRRFDAAVRAWRFTAGKVDGVPQPSQTTLTANLRMEPVDGGYRARLLRAGTGARYAQRTAPKYPDGALASHRGGGVMLLVHYDADGKVVDAIPETGGEPKAGIDLERAAVVAVRHWTFQPETIGGHGLAGAARVPMCFKVEPSRLACRFIDPSSKQPIDEDRPLALGSVVHLETNVADRTL